MENNKKELNKELCTSCANHSHDDDKEEESYKHLIIGTILLIVSILLRNTKFGFIQYVITYIVLAHKIILEAIDNIKDKEFFGEEFLMSLSSLIALFLREGFEANIIILLYSIGELFEDRSIDKSRESIEKLLDLKDNLVNLFVGEEVKRISVEDIKVGDIILLKPGDKVVVDGIVVDGESFIDNKSITGESKLVSVSKNEMVYSGAINVDGNLKLRVEKEFKDSFATKILDLIENAYDSKTKSEKFITRFSRVYTPSVVILAILITIILPLFNIPFSESIRRAAIFLIVSCPCALAISIPLSFYSGISGLSKNGILVKGSSNIEKLSKVKNVIFDKTGTLTKGSFVVEDYSSEETLKLASYGENGSNHPISKAILNKYDEKINLNDISNYKEYAGLGIGYKYKDSEVLVGNIKLMDKFSIEVDNLDLIGTLVYVAKDNKYLGYILLDDEIKEDSKNAIEKINNMSINTVILSGDNINTTSKVASVLNIKNYFADLLPNEKSEKVKEYNNVAFVGDGINDALSLVTSDVGISMGSLGSDVAIEASDVVVMNDSIESVAYGIDYSKKIMRIVYFNIVFSLFVKLITILLSASGLVVNMWLAVFSDVGVLIICIINAIRLNNINIKDLFS